MRSFLAGLRSLVLPWGATTGQPRITLGPDIPTELQAGITGTPIAAVVWWVPSTSYPRTYRFQLWEQVGTDQASGYYHEGWVLNAGTPKCTRSEWFGVPSTTEVLMGNVLGSTVSSYELFADAIVGRDMTGGGGGIGAAHAESWHPMTLKNGWTNVGAGYATAQYRMLASPPKSLQLVGVLSAGTRTAGTSIAQLPVNYRPATIVRFPVRCLGASDDVPFIDFVTDGNLQINGLAATANLEFNAIVPLDA